MDILELLENRNAFINTISEKYPSLVQANAGTGFGGWEAGFSFAELDDLEISVYYQSEYDLAEFGDSGIVETHWNVSLDLFAGDDEEDFSEEELFQCRCHSLDEVYAAFDQAFLKGRKFLLVEPQ